MLEHDPRAAALIGVDVGKDAVLFALADLDGVLIHQRRVPLPFDHPVASVDTLISGVNVACLLDPEAIVLGGGVAHAAPAFVNAIEGRLEGRIPIRPTICLSQLGEHAGVVGAVALAAQRTSEYLAVLEG